MLEMQGVPREVVENAIVIFGRSQYVVQPNADGEIVDRIWILPLFSKSWLCMQPFERIEDEEIDVTPIKALVQKTIEEDNEKLMGFAFVESYWDENPDCKVFFGFFDAEKRMATRMVVYTSTIKDSDSWQIFMDFTKRHMYDEPFESTSEELQEIAAKLLGRD